MNESKRSTRFGVELEICWNYGAESCSNPTLLIEYESFNTLSFLDKCLYFLFYNALSNPGIVTFCKQFVPELGILYEDEDGELQRVIFDVRNPGTIAHPKYTVLDDKYDPRFAHYKIPIFTPDISLQCGDTSLNVQQKYKPANAKPIPPASMGIECITPVLEVHGEITEAKIQQAVGPFLALFGLLKPTCFFTNYSTGFHVNVSLAEDEKPIRLNCQRFLTFFVPDYIRYENRVYSKVRQRLREGAKFSAWAEPLSKVKDNILALENEANRTEKEDSLFLLKTKHWAVLLKQGSVFEFRLYGSETDWEKLADYTFQACHLMNTIYDRFLAKKAKGLLGGQTRRCCKLRRRLSRRLRRD